MADRRAWASNPPCFRSAARPLLLRPGVIPLPEIEALIGPVRIAAAPAEGAARLPRHAPAPLPARHAALSARARRRPRRQAAARWLRLGHEMPADPVAYAAALYETLHRLDRQHLDWIAVEHPPETPAWAGVLDRLRHAAA